MPPPSPSSSHPILHFESLSLVSSPPDSLSPASTPSDDDDHGSFVSHFDPFPAAHSPALLPVAHPSKPDAKPLQEFETQVRDAATAVLQTSKRRPSSCRSGARRGEKQAAASSNKGSERRASRTNADATELLASWKATSEPLSDRSNNNVKRCGGGNDRPCPNNAASDADENCESASAKKGTQSGAHYPETAEWRRNGAEEEEARGRRGNEMEEASGDYGGGAKSPLGPAGSGRQQKNKNNNEGMRERLIERRRRRKSGSSVRESLLAEAWERKREQQQQQQQMKLLLQKQQSQEEDHPISPSHLHFRSPEAAAAASATEVGAISSLIHDDSPAAAADGDWYNSPSLSSSSSSSSARSIHRRSSSFRHNYHQRTNNSNSSNNNIYPRSLTDEDFAELRGCIDLGFRFDQSSVPELSDTLPALQVVCAVAQNLPTDYCLSPVRSPAARCSSPSSPSWRVSSPGDDPKDVKGRLRHWAQAVACNAKLCY